MTNKKHLKNVGPIRHCEPPHADVHNNNDDDDNDNAWQRGPLWPHRMGPINQRGVFTEHVGVDCVVHGEYFIHCSHCRLYGRRQKVLYRLTGTWAKSSSSVNVTCVVSPVHTHWWRMSASSTRHRDVIADVSHRFRWRVQHNLRQFWI